MKEPVDFGNYRLLDRISVGGMAEVFRAKAFGVEGFERMLAVKRILPSIAEDEEFITMFIDEAKIAVQLQHANIAQIFDLGKVDESYFIAMEYVEGKDLRAIYERMKKRAQTVSIPMAVYVIMKMCEGLDYAHNKKDSNGEDLNLVHRDVSPQNVLVSYDGQVKLIDFGIAKAAGKAGKTQAGILKGKFGYMSPEQVRGNPLDRRSDIFAVGICLWELVTGQRLFVGESDFATLERVRNVDIESPQSYNKRIPDELEKIVLKSLEKDVSERYQSAIDLHDDLQSWMYTSGSFFARKDLAAFQQEVFREDIEKMAAKNDELDEKLRNEPAPPPPPRAGATPPAPRPSSAGSFAPPAPRPSSAGSFAPPAPPSPRVTAAPPAPPRASATPPPSGPPRPSATEPGHTTPPPRASSPAVPAPSPKKTMLGVPAAQPPKPQETKPTPPPAARAAADVEWDDDEEPTNIYGSDNAAEIAASMNVSAAKSQPQAKPTPPVSSAAPPRPSSLADSTITQATAPPVKPKKNNMAVVGIVAAVSLVVAVGIVVALSFFGKSGAVELTVDPGDDLSVVVDGDQPVPQNISPLTIEELSEGTHTFVINKEGYETKTVTLMVKSGKVLQTKVSLDKAGEGEDAQGAATASFYLESDPQGASVKVDGRLVDDKTPLTVSDLAAGTHVVELSKDSYGTLTFDVELAAAQQAKLPKKMLPLAKVELVFNTEPQGAPVTLIEDGRRIDLGKTPATYEIETTANKEYKVEYECGGQSKLEPLSSSEFGQGEPKVSLGAVACAAATAAAPGRVGRKAPRVNSPKTPKTPAAPAAGGAPGFLSVQTKPWSKVYINNTFVKNTPLLKKSLKPGRYNVMVVNENFGIKRQFVVNIQSGKTTTLVKQLI